MCAARKNYDGSVNHSAPQLWFLFHAPNPSLSFIVSPTLRPLPLFHFLTMSWEASPYMEGELAEIRCQSDSHFLVSDSCQCC